MMMIDIHQTEKKQKWNSKYKEKHMLKTLGKGYKQKSMNFR